MGPVKFDDIPKVATEVLNDDYQVSGHVFKAKQKTSWGGAVLSSQVDMFADSKCATPAKLAWKLPSPFGFSMINVDKLEMDKGGKFKLEASSDKLYPGLKVECKSDLADVSKVTKTCTYTGIEGAQVKLECKPVKPQDFVGEATFSYGIATCGLKFCKPVVSGAVPDVGLRLLSGPFFCSLLAKDQLGTVGATALYKASPDLKCAAAYNYAVKGGTGSLTVGLAYKGLYKVKVSQDQSVCCSAKHNLAKGFSLLCGAKYSVKKGDFSYGMQLSIE